MAERQNLSRREFASAAALAAAAAAFPFEVIAQTEKTPAPVKPQQPPAEQAGKELSSAANAEVQQSYQALISKYGERFSDDQKQELLRLLQQQQKSIEAVRGVFLDNGDEPATVLHLEGTTEKSHGAE